MLSTNLGTVAHVCRAALPTCGSRAAASWRSARERRKPQAPGWPPMRCPRSPSTPSSASSPSRTGSSACASTRCFRARSTRLPTVAPCRHRPLEVDLARGDRRRRRLPAVAGVGADDGSARPRRPARLRRAGGYWSRPVSFARDQKKKAMATSTRAPSHMAFRSDGNSGPAASSRTPAALRRGRAPGSARRSPGGGQGLGRLAGLGRPTSVSCSSVRHRPGRRRCRSSARCYQRPGLGGRPPVW